MDIACAVAVLTMCDRTTVADPCGNRTTAAGYGGDPCGGIERMSMLTSLPGEGIMTVMANVPDVPRQRDRYRTWTKMP